jgi:hypothetical protein
MGDMVKRGEYLRPADRPNQCGHRGQPRTEQRQPGNNTNTGDILFDQILFPPSVGSFYVEGSLRIFDAGIAIDGTGGNNGDQASDHLPVYADFVFGGTVGGETPVVGVRISSLLANPEGEDQGKESVANTNEGTIVIDLTGWKLRDRAGGEAPLSGQLAPDRSTT